REGGQRGSHALRPPQRESLPCGATRSRDVERQGSAHPHRALLSGALDPFFGARRAVRVVLVRLVHVAVALAVLDTGQDVAEQSRLAILELTTEFVQDRSLHAGESTDCKDRV